MSLTERRNVNVNDLYSFNRMRGLLFENEIDDFASVLDSSDDNQVQRCRGVLCNVKSDLRKMFKSMDEYGCLNSVFVKDADTKDEAIQHESIVLRTPAAQHANTHQIVDKIEYEDLSTANRLWIDGDVADDDAKKKRMLIVMDKEDNQINWLSYSSQEVRKYYGIEHVALEKLKSGKFKLSYFTAQKEFVIILDPRESSSIEKLSRKRSKDFYKREVSNPNVLQRLKNSLIDRYEINFDGEVSKTK